MLNKVLLIGYVGKDPEVRTLTGGHRVANLTLATTERGYTTQNGQTVPDRTEWHNLVIWGRGADVIENYVRKGSLLHVEGKIKTRSWDDQNGQKRYSTEIQVDTFLLLDRRNNSNEETVNAGSLSGGSPGTDNDGDLPF